jgi:arsenate reductase
MTITIYHNPNCGTSRNTLAMIRQSGEEPVVIEYLKHPPTRERLIELIAAMGIPVRALLREKGAPYAELGLGDPKWSDDELVDFMMAHPILINRPIVVTPKGARLCRPSERVLDLLPTPNIGRFMKEDGEVVGKGKTERPRVTLRNERNNLLLKSRNLCYALLMNDWVHERAGRVDCNFRLHFRRATRRRVFFPRWSA